MCTHGHGDSDISKPIMPFVVVTDMKNNILTLHYRTYGDSESHRAHCSSERCQHNKYQV